MVFLVVGAAVWISRNKMNNNSRKTCRKVDLENDLSDGGNRVG